jgi:hypothetical protein
MLIKQGLWIKDLYVGTNKVLLSTLNGSLIAGKGSSSSPLSFATADKNFIGLWLKSTATTGTTRGLYQRLYLSSGAGGECARLFTTVENDTPADTVNGAHVSLSFGSAAGNVTGEGQAVRGTLHIPNRSLGGTCAAIKAELWADGSSSAVGGTLAFIRATAGGNQTGIDKIDDSGFLLALDGVTAGAAHLFRTGLTAATINAATTCALRVKIGATTYFIPVSTAAEG